MKKIIFLALSGRSHAGGLRLWKYGQGTFDNVFDFPRPDAGGYHNPPKRQRGWRNPSSPKDMCRWRDPVRLRRSWICLLWFLKRRPEVTYGIVKDQYAYMTFTYDGVEYRYEVGKGEHSLAADTTAYAQTKNADWLDYPYTMAWTEGGAGMGGLV